MSLELISKTPAGAARPTPLLFVHGAWHGAWCWDVHFLDYFAAHGYAVHALSLRGHGKSEGRARLRRARLKDYVADVAQIANQLPARPVVIGHSMGGAVVQKYLETHAAPAGVLLASMPPAGVLATTLRIARNHPLIFLKVNLTLSLYPLMATPQLARASLFSAALPEAEVMDYAARLQDESFFAFLGMLAFELPHPQKVAAPMLVLGGEADTIFLPGEIEATARAYNTRATLFPGMAHDMMLEPEWQQAADHILKWLGEKEI